jgi:hypothetical protein
MGLREAVLKDMATKLEQVKPAFLLLTQSTNCPIGLFCKREGCGHLIYNMIIKGPHLWSSGQSSWLQMQRSTFDFWRYQIF